MSNNMTDLKDKTVEDLREWADIESYHEMGQLAGPWIEAFDELAPRLKEAQQRSEAKDAEVAAKAREEVYLFLRRKLWERAAKTATDEDVDHICDELERLKAAEYRAKAVISDEEESQLPKFYTTTKCSQCGKSLEWIRENGCPENCGRAKSGRKE